MQCYSRHSTHRAVTYRWTARIASPEGVNLVKVDRGQQSFAP